MKQWLLIVCPSLGASAVRVHLGRRGQSDSLRDVRGTAQTLKVRGRYAKGIDVPQAGIDSERRQHGVGAGTGCRGVERSDLETGKR